MKSLYDDVDKNFLNLTKKIKGNKNVKIDFKPFKYVVRKPSMQLEKKVDSELICPVCKCRFQVYGIFGFCPGCRTENILIYDANLEIIKQEINASNDPIRALRHAYSDIVSSFESFCKKKAPLLTENNARFQELFESRKFFKKYLKIDIFDKLNNDDLLVLRRVFQKRHSYEHNEGIIGEKYVRLIPEDKHLLGKKADLSIEEFVSASQSLRIVIEEITSALKNQNLL